MENKVILLNHGSGGRLTHQLIDSVFASRFSNPVLEQRSDSAVMNIGGERAAFTTDSFVVNPLFFPGGDIGKLSVCGTVNDLAVSGATPLALSASFIIEEGFPFSDLERIADSMAKTALEAGVSIVTGDTKVVNRGKADRLFITTAGIGSFRNGRACTGSCEGVKPGDVVIVNGFLGDHGMAILAAREGMTFSADVKSDCAALNRIIADVLDKTDAVAFMRDATRGGLGTVLCELAEDGGVGIEIDEKALPVRKAVRGMCDMFGFDPLFIANEGKVVMVVREEAAPLVLDIMRKNPQGKDAAIVGLVTDEASKVKMKTVVGGTRIISMPAGDQLPRIC